MRISAESGVRYLQIFDMFLRWQFASLHIFFHMLFHTEAIVHYDPTLQADDLGAMNSSPTRTYSRFGLWLTLELMTTRFV